MTSDFVENRSERCLIEELSDASCLLGNLNPIMIRQERVQTLAPMGKLPSTAEGGCTVYPMVLANVKNCIPANPAIAATLCQAAFFLVTDRYQSGAGEHWELIKISFSSVLQTECITKVCRAEKSLPLQQRGSDSSL